MTRLFISVFCAVVCCLLLPGCAQLAAHDDYWIKPSQARPSGRTGALLLYADYVRNLSATNYTRELDHARQLAAQDKSQFRQLQYALALMAPSGDIRRAQQVLDAAKETGGQQDPELSALTTLISVNLAERRRLEARLELRMETGAKRIEELEQKLEAVKNIEKNMIGRDKP